MLVFEFVLVAMKDNLSRGVHTYTWGLALCVSRSTLTHLSTSCVFLDTAEKEQTDRLGAPRRLCSRNENKLIVNGSD